MARQDHNFNDIKLLVRVFGEQYTSQNDVATQRGEGAAANRLIRAGLLFRPFKGAGHHAIDITNEGYDFVERMVAMLEQNEIERGLTGYTESG